MKLPQPKHLRWLQEARSFVEAVAECGNASTKDLRIHLVERRVEIRDVTFATEGGDPCLVITLEDGSTWTCFVGLDVRRNAQPPQEAS